MKKQTHKHDFFGKHNLLRFFVLALVLAMALLLLLFAVFLWESDHGLFPGEKKDWGVIEYEGKRYRAKDGIVTALVLGLDKFDGAETAGGADNDMQADFLLLLVFDTKNETVSALHINRDTMAEVDLLGLTGQKVGTVRSQLALAHTEGDGAHDSCRNTANAVSTLLDGERIDYYVSLKMDAVAILNDAVGGVTLEVIGDFSDVDAALAEGETVTLMGEQALLYVRARKGMDVPTNLARMDRQRQYLTALYQKLSDGEKFGNEAAGDLAATLSPYMVSNCSIERMEDLLAYTKDYVFDGILSLAGETRPGDRFMEFTPDPAQLKETILALFYEIKS